MTENQAALPGEGLKPEKMPGLLASQPFESVEMDNFYMEKTPKDAWVYVPGDGDTMTTPAVIGARHGFDGALPPLHRLVLQAEPPTGF